MTSRIQSNIQLARRYNLIVYHPCLIFTSKVLYHRHDVIEKIWNWIIYQVFPHCIQCMHKFIDTLRAVATYNVESVHYITWDIASFMRSYVTVRMCTYLRSQTYTTMKGAKGGWTRDSSVILPAKSRIYSIPLSNGCWRHRILYILRKSRKIFFQLSDYWNTWSLIIGLTWDDFNFSEASFSCEEVHSRRCTKPILCLLSGFHGFSKFADFSSVWSLFLAL